MASILITGASGFIGSFLVEEALRQGMETWACVRASSSRRYLKDSRIGFFEADLGDTQALRVRLLRHRQEHGAFDYVVHCAGVTRPLRWPCCCTNWTWCRSVLSTSAR